jgi:hypothetical protein
LENFRQGSEGKRNPGETKLKRTSVLGSYEDKMQGICSFEVEIKTGMNKKF